jgi:SAM-dependent methyltransferase
MASKKIVHSLILLCAATWAQLNAGDEVEKIFTEIYGYGAWGHNLNGRGFSGTGSTVLNAAPYMAFLENFIRANNIQSVLDVGCGDWLFSQHINWSHATYTGMDVVKYIIDRNTQLYASPKIQFIHYNGEFTDLPAADLIICKDVLQHLSNDKILSFLTQLHKYKYCLLTNDTEPSTFSSTNYDIVSGDHRFLDLSKPPFNLKGVKIFHYRSEYVIKQVFYIERYF